MDIINLLHPIITTVIDIPDEDELLLSLFVVLLELFEEPTGVANIIVYDKYIIHKVSKILGLVMSIGGLVVTLISYIKYIQKNKWMNL